VHREKGQITLTHLELEEIKKDAQDDGKFKEKVLTHIKMHSGLIQIVSKLEERTVTNQRLIFYFFVAILGLAVKVIAK